MNQTLPWACTERVNDVLRCANTLFYNYTIHSEMISLSLTPHKEKYYLLLPSQFFEWTFRFDGNSELP